MVSTGGERVGGGGERGWEGWREGGGREGRGIKGEMERSEGGSHYILSHLTVSTCLVSVRSASCKARKPTETVMTRYVN